MKNWQLYHFLDVRKILGAASLNFIRSPRVVITPTVTTLLRGENDSKRSDEVQAKERQASKKFYNKCSENSRSQIVFQTDIFRKLSLVAPGNSENVRNAVVVKVRQ